MKNETPAFFTRLIKKHDGFSLIEVMVVVAIIGILATLAIPNFTGWIASSKQTEAKTNLMAMYTAQKVFFASNQKYASDFNDLAFEIPQDAKYTYTIEGRETTFTITAEANLDDDATNDVWTIDQDKKLLNTTTDAAN